MTTYPLDEYFTYQDPDTRQIRCFNVTRMRRFALVAGKLIHFPLYEAMVQSVAENRGIEEPKLKRLREPYLSQPILCIAYGDGTYLTVDGHHRMVRRWQEGFRAISAYVLEVGQWERFVL